MNCFLVTPLFEGVDTVLASIACATKWSAKYYVVVVVNPHHTILEGTHSAVCFQNGSTVTAAVSPYTEEFARRIVTERGSLEDKDLHPNACFHTYMAISLPSKYAYFSLISVNNVGGAKKPSIEGSLRGN